VVSIVRNLDPPGRFLATLHESDKNFKHKDGSIVWHDVGDKKARAKASQCLREKKIESPSVDVEKMPGSEIQDVSPPQKSQDHNREDSPCPNSLNIYNNHKVICDAFEEDTEDRHHLFPVYSDCQHNMELHHNESYHHHATTTMPTRAATFEEVRHGHLHDAEPLSYHQKFTGIQPVTPCDEVSNKRPRTCYVRESQHKDDYQYRQPKRQNSEFDFSWIGSFCSLETRMIEEVESISLSPPMMLSPKPTNQRNENNFPNLLRSASWASSDVKSELTDNSHIKDFN
jgi:hypothetical protein